jgi:hypothetical protein
MLEQMKHIYIFTCKLNKRSQSSMIIMVDDDDDHNTLVIGNDYFELMHRPFHPSGILVQQFGGGGHSD